MAYKEFLSKIEDKGKIVKEVISTLQSDWDNLVFMEGDFKNPIETVYDCYPYLFKSIFLDVEEEEFRQLSIAGRLFAASIIMYDEFLDNEFFEKNTRKMFSPLVMQWESQKILNKLFNSDALFWKRFERYYKEHIRACTLEETFHNNKDRWSDYTEELWIKVAIGKNGISRAVISGLVELSGKESIHDSLVEAINHFNIACQVLDDLIDWKNDLKNSIPSLLLHRVYVEKPHLVKSKNTDYESDIAKIIYYNGHATYLISLALNSIKQSSKLLRQFDGDKTDWYILVKSIQKKLEALKLDIKSIINKNIQRVYQKPQVNISIPSPSNDSEFVSSTSLKFLIEQWNKGFGEARHIMKLSKDQGFSTSSESQYYYGDIFQRALILETFAEVQNKSNINLESIINYEIDYLLQQQRQDNVGGWAYFPNVIEIASDADDLGQIIQAFVVAEHKELSLAYCEKPIKVLLKNNLLEDGSIETWIVPKKDRTQAQETQHRYNLQKWGIGPDNEVVANLFYALFLYDPQRYEKLIDNASAYIESVQNRNGSWDSRWYYGLYYGTFVCSRLINSIKPDAETLKAATYFIRKNQNADGGWGNLKSDQLNTSLALLTLLNCCKFSETNYQECVIPAITYLKKSIENSKLWDEIDFIKPRIGEPYKSQTITAMYVCKATTSWQYYFTLRDI